MKEMCYTCQLAYEALHFTVIHQSNMTTNTDDIRLVQEQVMQQHPVTEAIRKQLHRVIVGQDEMIDRLLIGLYTNGHILLEGVPGLAKTLTIKSLAQTLHVSFSRIQFTPDLLPADVVGTMIYNQQRGEFMVRKGPIFAQFILADEINRAPAKVQSALLEAMQERQVTLGDTSFALNEPFLVLATQNPLEQEGTYPLPEAQQDRFLLKVKVDYPKREEERQIMRDHSAGTDQTDVQAVADAVFVLKARRICRSIYMDARIEDYILDLVLATRNPAAAGLAHLKPMMAFGASPRASIAMALAARAAAMLQQRSYVIPEDVKSIAPDVLRHRIGLTYEAAAEGIGIEEVLSQVLRKIKTP
jgi:MoxR-like ATPase